MASSSSTSNSSSIFRSANSMHRRPSQSDAAAIENDPTGVSAGHISSAAKNPCPISKLVAFGSIIILGLLQFLPATHFRHPSDPLRNWVPFHSDLSSSMDKDSGLMAEDGRDDTMLHIVSWMDSLDLRMLTVLANSTLTSSRYPEHVHFHFYTPEGNDDKMSYFKLKVLFPHSNLELLGQEEVKTAIMKAYSLEDYAGPSMDQIAPFVIPIVHPWIRKFIYVSPNVIMKGRVEELVGFNLRHYAVGIAEDCSKRLSMSVNSEILDAIQRSASKPWVSRTPYAQNACMPESSLILIDATKIEKDVMEAILWWSIVLNSRERRIPDPAIALALYNRHLKLPGSWRVSNLTSSEINYRTLVLCYDKAMNMSLRLYLPPMSDQILGS